MTAARKSGATMLITMLVRLRTRSTKARADAGGRHRRQRRRPDRRGGRPIRAVEQVGVLPEPGIESPAVAVGAAERRQRLLHRAQDRLGVDRSAGGTFDELAVIREV